MAYAMSCRNFKTLFNKNGFTFLELIISFSILTLILIIVLGALRLSFRFWDRGEEVSFKAQEQRMIWSSLKHQLGSIYPYWVRMGTKKLLLFKGEEDQIEFVSLFSCYLQDKGGLRYCRYKIEEDEKGKGFSLKVSETKVLNADLGELDIADERFRILVSGLPSFIFEYADQNKTDGPVQWFSSWKGKERERLPVKIRFAFKEKYHDMEELSFAFRSKGYGFSR
jgi:general secretion pathway protein J